MDIREAGPANWDDVVSVMGTKGDPATCWCQFFRVPGKEFHSMSVDDVRCDLHRQVHEQADPPGLLAYVDGEPAGWVAVAPKADYPRLVASRATGEAVDGVWSVSCFVVRAGFRRRGVSSALLSAAVDFARARGARIVEAYPTDLEAAGTRSSADLYRGVLSSFLAAGFTEAERPYPARTVVRLEV